jgi:glycine C-acetyltransferase
LLATVQRLAQVRAENRDFSGGTRAAVLGRMPRPISLDTHTLEDFAPTRSEDVLARCDRFAGFTSDFSAREDAGGQYRVEIEGPLDHHVTVRDEHGGPRRIVCFDSNGYLGLQRDPRVVAAVHRALDEVGYGTPSAQLLGGTSRHLRELEDTVSAFLGREATAIFPSGYAANVGTLTALLGPKDVVVHDRFSHASVIDGCRYAGVRSRRAYAHLDTSMLDRLLAATPKEARGRLVVSDGVFSMHGTIADLPALRASCDRHGARLMIDDAHGLGVLGPRGRGLEDHFAMTGAADILMGTFSKAPGALGGYVSGSRALVEYLRYFARAGVFTAALPAATCAGLATAFRIMEHEPEHRLRLWENARLLWSSLRDVGWSVPASASPIVTVFVGHERLLFRASRELFERGFKVGVVTYPAVPKNEAVLRLSVSARHTRDDIDRVVDALASIGQRYGILFRPREEVVAIGARLALEYRASAA